jgi:hypothetical protein
MDGFTWLTGNAITGTLTALALGLIALITVGALDWLIERVACKQGEDWQGEGNVPPSRWWR